MIHTSMSILIVPDVLLFVVMSVQWIRFTSESESRVSQKCIRAGKSCHCLACARVLLFVNMSEARLSMQSWCMKRKCNVMCS